MPHIEIGKGRGGPFKFYYELHGEGPEKIVMVMGFLTPCSSWDRQLDYLKGLSGYQICIFDNRGVGHSSGPTFEYSSKHMAKDIIELVDYLKWDKFHVVGISMGGMISIELATMVPNKISTLFLAVTHAGSLPPLSGILTMSKSFLIRSHRSRGEQLMKILYSEKYLNQMSEHVEGKTNRQYVVDRYVENCTNNKTPGLAAVVGHIRTVFTHNVSPKRLAVIRDSKIPITIITGTDDHLVKHSNSYYLRDNLNPSEFIVIDGAGHCVNVENNDTFNEAMLRTFKKSIPLDTSSTSLSVQLNEEPTH
eukprot:gene5391-6724_t